MTIAYVVIFLSVLLFGASAVWALAWAASKGQLENFQQGAVSIFDADEPVGRETDAFPKHPGAQRRHVREEGPNEQ